MPDFSNITLVSVTGLDHAQGAAYALELSARRMPGARVVLFSPQCPAHLSPVIHYRAIAPMNYYEYSWFMLFGLWRFIDTEYAIVVQDDGWVLDAANWRDEFLQYDYIGATNHLAWVTSPSGSGWMGEFSWCSRLGQSDHVIMPVLNGGFSLRSRRMMRALIDHPHIKYELSPPDFVGGEPIEIRWLTYAQNEDVQLTAVLRERLEGVGLRYPPLAVCQRFSLEFAGYHDGGTDPMQLFGHHCRWRRLVSIDPPTVRYSVPRSTMERAFRETDVVQMLLRRGYRVEFATEPA
ncbi:DUF5672 family protein [Caballeronia sp. LZ019]|uniref:DUF5672 family protein n=1 Tax=Caballeronia sp. LZ019 TaxID=3038555 RepID=UPI0028592480|nr:DUF5672 family protein [Caballeronia sp. LZ019]MDR5809464.1 DUF5672 family protein [Caballeronia sp. LZ019]